MPINCSISKLPDEIHEELNEYPELTRHLLFNRGLSTKSQVAQFLNPVFEDNHDPMLMPGMKKGVERFLQAIDANEHVVIYSDYDADGIPGAVLFASFLKKIGYTNYSHYIPDRHEEGFGVNESAIDEILNMGTGVDHKKLMITIDCGIADVAAIKKAQKLGIDVILTDHHLPGEVLPPAFTIVNPKVSDEKSGEEYPYNMLCGSGVIFKFVQGILTTRSFEEKGMKPGHEKWLLDMVGIGTLSDMVPLTGENRIFAHYGLAVLRKSPRIGLRKLLSKQRINQMSLCEDDIGFSISPRINAASRMGKAETALNLFLSESETDSDALFSELDKLNTQRKTIVATISRELHRVIDEEAVSKNINNADRCVIVRGNPLWRPSLLGLVSNSLVERYRCPVFLWGRGDGEVEASGGNSESISEKVIKGSCRSDGSVSVVEAMNTAQKLAKKELKKDLFIGFGGHDMSGGFSLSNEMVHHVGIYLEKAVVTLRKNAEGLGLADNHLVDFVLSLDDVHSKTFKELSRLAPFGIGNPKPLFMFKDVVPVEVKQFGKHEEHFKMSFKTDKNSNGYKSAFAKNIEAIAFFARAEDFEIKPEAGQPLTLLAHIEQSQFMGRSDIRLRVVEIF